MLTFKGIQFSSYELMSNYVSGFLNKAAADKAATEVQDLQNNISLTPGTIPSCAYLEAYVKKYPGSYPYDPSSQ